jgi:hypothetical protein
MAEIMEPETLPICDRNTGRLCSRPQVIGDKCGWRQRRLAVAPERREDKVRALRVRALLTPIVRAYAQYRMHGNVVVRGLGLRLAVLALSPALGDANASLVPTNVRPAESNDLRCPESGRRAGQNEGEVQQVIAQAPKNGHRLRRSYQNGLVRGGSADLDRNDRVLDHLFVNNSDGEDSCHEAPDLGDGSPFQAVFFMQRFQPTLDFDGLDILRNLLAPAGNEVVTNIMFCDRDAGVGFRAPASSP